jgi:putative phosphoribosyl transferase
MHVKLIQIRIEETSFMTISLDSTATRSASGDQRELLIKLGQLHLHGNLSRPRIANGLVLFAHGSGSSRMSPRNCYVAEALNQGGFATCLFDLLTEEEEKDDQLTQAYRFNIGLLAERLVHVTDWLENTLNEAEPGLAEGFPVGYFGASTGAAAALIAAADRPHVIKAIVSRGGRPDLAAEALPRVEAPTLLLVGELDGEVIRLNREASEELSVSQKEVIVIPGATHLFQEPGKLEQVADYAAKWFQTHMGNQSE